MNSILVFSFIFSTLCVACLGAKNGSFTFSSSQVITRGSSLSLQTDQNSSWPSLSGDFAFGFYKQGYGFAVGIWIVGAESATVVWTANRDDPPVTPHAKVVFTNDGQFLLITEQGEAKQLANMTASHPASFAAMLDSGNFVLYDENMEAIWQSFEHPTDTVLQGQILPFHGQLFSSVSEADHSTGRFRLKIQENGRVMLYPLNTEDSPVDAYLDMGYFNERKGNFYMNYSCTYFFINDSTSAQVREVNVELSSSVNNVKQLRLCRVTIEPDGVFRLYNQDREGNGELGVPRCMWSAPHPCQVKGICGLNSYCTYNDAQTNCLCIPGTDFDGPKEEKQGCLRNYTELGCIDGTKNAQFYNISRIENMLFGDKPYSSENMPMEQCGKSCLEDCNCDAAFYGYENGICWKYKLPLVYLRRDIERSRSSTAFFKVRRGTGLEGRDESTGQTEMGNLSPIVKLSNKKASVHIIVLVIGCALLSFFSLAIGGVFIFKIRVLAYKRLRDRGTLGVANEDDLTLRVFSYNDLKRATNRFKEVLGKGNFGAVYKGSIDKGRKLVAVKRLEKLVEEGEREFRAEMRAIGRTNHKNLVRLLGYCAEGSKRLLVYEYMSNGSLADLIFNKNSIRLHWEERVQVAIDIARGILYLHEECKTPIIHCDIKPQNILMDDFWTAKISDFGLSKLLMPDQTRTFTGIRGTRGYLAPEWHQNIPISVKADVYSFGVMLLEIMCCRRNLEPEVPNTEEIILSNWVYKCFAARELNKLDVREEADKKSLENMVKIGLWCIQDEPHLRPSMKSVVLMLEGITDISIPPCPTSSSM